MLINKDTEEKERIFWWHWQNLNDKPGYEGSGFWSGRAWFYLKRVCFAIEWHFKSWACHASVSFGGEHDISWSIAFPPVSLYFHLDRVFPRWLRNKFYDEREIRISIFDWTPRLTIWRDPMGGWSSRERWWQRREWYFNITDLVFGSTKCEKTIKAIGLTLIPMPEGVYEAEYKIEDYVWTRKRWPGVWLKRRDYWLDIKGGGIPIPGKGESAWDCGDTALCGVGGRSLEDAIANAVKSALETRMKYGGPNWKPQSEPALQIKYGEPDRRFLNYSGQIGMGNTPAKFDSDDLLNRE